MIKINKERLVMQSVQGKIHSPTVNSPYRVDRNGQGRILPATGGITYNVKLGDSCMNLVGDHIEPGVSIKNENTQENNALMMLSCIGNEAVVISGNAKDARGIVTGMHSGIDHVLIYFNDEDMNKMAIGDTILVKAFGQGLKIEGFEDVTCMNLDPNLFEKIDLKIDQNGTLEVPIVAEIPAYLMGSGIGSSTAFMGDYDIMTGDKEANKTFGIDKLKFGDLVLLRDCDNTNGRQYLKGAVSIGVVIHSDCVLSGHGPGVTVIMSSKTTKIKGIFNDKANIGHYLGID
ncbi:conserved protein of unknown function [Tepidanaerobacter acetatoxydans Re1]|uniref:DUF4438 domain-containing protein n=1 Tax=Tepidanaerobacter acetatoxydans (strain DSM 21804 / JCM 16047 / Re1) TaxID=1209989 RepID=F4LVS1_TEPAE|nr:DUF4438 domain-containing protein [Tepidanaerobacter acetatoxydans]AEE90768.1 hypothetical protein TepRe1_0580 [Tepidanaerobacter acetatoxydans Re1]CCP25323.1 conserved protein of unknown function [Tepidanaerobacter acetatoxydans Re1]